MDKTKIKKKCAEIAKALKEGMTPQEVAKMFGAVKQGVNDTSCDDEYIEYLVDFAEGFGITFWQSPDVTLWHWENEDEIWLNETEDFAHWKSL